MLLVRITATVKMYVHVQMNGPIDHTYHFKQLLDKELAKRQETFSLH